MRRREFITLLGGAAAAWPLAARAQQTMPVVGLLAATSVLSWQSKSIQKGLNEGGYVEGRNLAIMYRSADAQLDRLPALAADLVDSKVSVIFAVGAQYPHGQPRRPLAQFLLCLCMAATRSMTNSLSA